jgi:shikimate dehydrogenase
VADGAFSLGLTGYPLGHSLSPRLHAAAFQATGLVGEYALYPVSPDDIAGLSDLLARLRAGRLHGLNVTIPHKQAVIPLLDELTPGARAIGAVNTLFMRDGRLLGDNTDAPGFLADLDGFLAAGSGTSVPPGSTTGRCALVLGAGGSARAVVYSLVHAGWRVMVAARRVEQAKVLLAAYLLPDLAPQGRVVEYTAAGLGALPASPDLIVNTTPLGMFPKTRVSPWPAGLPLPHAAVYDLVYNPRETLLSRQARAAGLPARTGLGMLVEQAALAFEIWTARRPPRAPLFAAADLPDA